MVRILVVSLVSLMFILSTESRAERVYKWRDANGKLHFGSVPPPESNGEAESLNLGSANAYAPNSVAGVVSNNVQSNQQPDAIRKSLLAKVQAGGIGSRAAAEGLLDMERSNIDRGFMSPTLSRLKSILERSGSRRALALLNELNGGQRIREADNQSKYSGRSGNVYEYDLSKPIDRLKYQNDPQAQQRDRMNQYDPLRDLEQDNRQYGGGVVK